MAEPAASPAFQVATSRHLATFLAAQRTSLAFSTYRTGQLFLIGLEPTDDLSVSIRPSIRGAVGSASPRRAAGRFDVARDRARILPRGGAVELDLSAGRIWRRLTAEERLAAGTEAAR